MNFTLLSLPVVSAGILLIAALLYFLQRLQPRRQVLRLPAALLWQQVARELPSRVLGRRFQCWLTWLLSLLIAVLLWMSVAGLEANHIKDSRPQLFYLDASAWMLAGDNFAKAREALLSDLARLQAEQREVYLGDADGSLLLRAGEPLALLSKRLQEVQAQAYPPNFGRWLADMARSHGASSTLRVRYYGAQAQLAITARVPDGIELDYGHLAPLLERNRGIVNFGVAAAESGDWHKVDVLLELAAVGMPLPALEQMHLQLKGKPWKPSTVAVLETGRWLLRNVPANGGVLTVTLDSADDFAVDDKAYLELPQRTAIRVALSSAVPATIRSAIELDPALHISAPEHAQVRVQVAGEPQSSQLPSLLLTTPDNQPSAFVFGYVSDVEKAALQANLVQMGLSQTMTSALAEQLQCTVGVELLPATQRSVSVWSSVFASDTAFVQSPKMPLFVARSLRWLVQVPAMGAYVQAGRRPKDVADISTWTSIGGVDPLPVLVDLPATGEQRVAGSDLVPVLNNRQLSLGVAAPSEHTVAVQAVTDYAFDVSWPWQLALLLGLLLLALEWWLFQRGWMP